MTNDLGKLIAAIDQLNAEDPNQELEDGRPRPKELLYSERMSEQLSRYYPAASDELRIAARGQHVQRWRWPRSDFPAGKAGYYRWRTELGRRHAEIVMGLMRDQDYSVESQQQVQMLLTKQDIKGDEQAQILEDVICQVFMRYYCLNFARKHSPEKVLDIVRKTLAKMSDTGQDAVLELPLDNEVKSLLAKAVMEPAK